MTSMLIRNILIKTCVLIGVATAIQAGATQTTDVRPAFGPGPGRFAPDGSPLQMPAETQTARDAERQADEAKGAERTTRRARSAAWYADQARNSTPD